LAAVRTAFVGAAWASVGQMVCVSVGVARRCFEAAPMRWLTRHAQKQVQEASLPAERRVGARMAVLRNGDCVAAAGPWLAELKGARAVRHVVRVGSGKKYGRWTGVKEVRGGR
jgi:hypothetical protein